MREEKSMLCVCLCVCAHVRKRGKCDFWSQLIGWRKSFEPVIMLSVEELTCCKIFVSLCYRHATLKLDFSIDS